MDPGQRERWIRFCDIIIQDNTAQTNHYNFPLCFFVLVDNYNKTRIAAQALMPDETIESFQWVMQQLEEATGILPKVLMTDEDLSMKHVVNDFPNIKHLFCLYHLGQNILKNLRSKLGDQYTEFIQDFYLTRNSLSEDVFEARFTNLLNKFPTASSYLQKLLSIKKSWACAYTLKIFTGGMQSIQRVESLNNLIKTAVNSKSTLMQVMEAIHQCLECENLNQRFISWSQDQINYNNQIVLQHVFPQIVKQINKYLTPNLAAEQQKQIVESTVYRAQIISLNNTEFNNQDIECNNDFIENIYDTSQSYLSALISENEYSTIQEIWKITCLTSTKSIHHVILFKDGRYSCTCLLLISSGIVCRHFFSILIESNFARFHIMLLPIRWCKDRVTEFERTKELFLTSSHHTELVPIVHQLNISTRMNLFQLDDCQENWVHKLDKKIRFNKTMSLAKQAIVLQGENDSNNELDDLLKDYIEKKNLSVKKKHKKENIEFLRSVITQGRFLLYKSIMNNWFLLKMF